MKSRPHGQRELPHMRCANGASKTLLSCPPLAAQDDLDSFSNMAPACTASDPRTHKMQLGRPGHPGTLLLGATLHVRQGQALRGRLLLSRLLLLQWRPHLQRHLLLGFVSGLWERSVGACIQMLVPIDPCWSSLHQAAGAQTPSCLSLPAVKRCQSCHTPCCARREGAHLSHPPSRA